MSDKRMELNREETVVVPITATTPRCEAWEFQFPDFNKPTIERLKEMVPSEARSYDPLTTTWTVDDEYIQDVADLLQQTWYHIKIEWVE